MESRYLGFKEDLKTEFKNDINRLSDDVIEAVVAFANTKGGVLYLGVEDSGKITGLHSDHKDITYLAAFVANGTIPVISVRVEKFEDEPDYIAIEVPQSRSIVATSSGKILRRRIKVDGIPEIFPYIPMKSAQGCRI